MNDSELKPTTLHFFSEWTMSGAELQKGQKRKKDHSLYFSEVCQYENSMAVLD